MDMPDLEELEWMESHGLLPEEEEYAYFDDPEQGFLPAAGVASKPHAPPQETAAAPAKPAGTHHSPYLQITNLGFRMFRLLIHSTKLCTKRKRRKPI